MKSRTEKGLPVYAIYKNPADYPGKFVLRRYVNEVPDEEPMCVSENFAEVRSNLPEGVTNIPLFPGDDPCLYETWI